LQIPRKPIGTAARTRTDVDGRTGAGWLWLRRGFRLASSKNMRILKREVRFVDPLKLLLGSVLQLGIGLKSIRVPYAYKVFIGLPNPLPRGIGVHA
jgi:hypothetical protein